MAISSTSFKPGNQVALGNDKTAKLSTFVQKALLKAKDLTEYENARTQAEAIAEDMVNSYWEAKNVIEKKAIFDTLADRTEGKPKQSTELSGEVSIVTPIYSGKSFVEPSDD
jgi:hypothetical protein